jgi:hypothetical protein
MTGRVKAAAVVFLYAFVTNLAFSHDEDNNQPRSATGDKIHIIQLQSSGPVTHAVETKFTLEIEAELHSAREGIARVWFNLRSPNSYRMVERHDLLEGRQRVTFTVTVTPVDWAERGSFMVLVNMGSNVGEAQWMPTAFAQQTIPVKR